MPTSDWPEPMTDERASEIIRKAFPKGLKKPHTFIQVHDLIDALLYARTKCANECLGYCIKWAYEMNKERYKP